jgi:hypothetical protein
MNEAGTMAKRLSRIKPHGSSIGDVVDRCAIQLHFRVISRSDRLIQKALFALTRLRLLPAAMQPGVAA